MQCLWNAMTAAMITHESKDVSFEPEPGAIAVSSPSLKQSYRTMTNNLKTSFDQFNLRDCVLSSCQELNRAEFFVLLQMSLLVFFPSLGMSIIFQQYDVDEVDADQHDDDQYIGWTRNCTMEQQRSQQQFTMEQQKTQQTQFVQFVQQLISSIQYRSQSDAASQSQSLTKSTQTANIGLKISAPTNAHGSEEAMREIRVTTKVWRTVLIHF